jgi:hypothetical protein
MLAISARRSSGAKERLSSAKRMDLSSKSAHSGLRFATGVLSG